MKKLWKAVLFWAVLLGMFGYVYAADFHWVTGSEAITITSTPSGLTEAKFHNVTTGAVIANNATFTVEGTNIRYTVDGTTPTASVGIPTATNGSVSLWFDELKKFKAYSAGSATAYVTYRKYFATE